MRILYKPRQRCLRRVVVLHRGRGMKFTTNTRLFVFLVGCLIFSIPQLAISDVMSENSPNDDVGTLRPDCSKMYSTCFARYQSSSSLVRERGPGNCSAARSICESAKSEFRAPTRPASVSSDNWRVQIQAVEQRIDECAVIYSANLNRCAQNAPSQAGFEQCQNISRGGVDNCMRGAVANH
jgi:hypothetical protein